MAVSMQVDIVSAEGEIFSGKAEMLYAQAADGEVGVMPHHTQFLSSLKPGPVRVVSGDEESHFYINSGIIEIQPSVVTVLADAAVRAADLDEQGAEEARRNAEEQIANPSGDFDHKAAALQLEEALAQLKLIQQLRK